jgi:hypothetical protein|nr:MAG TPA: hypothetical protein [Caudoviricetes sp.]
MQLHIKWDTGHMTINCEAFFPAPQNKLNVLLKTINLDWEHKDDILNQMMQFLKDLEQQTEAKKVEIKSEYSKEYQKMKDLEHLISDCRHPNGVPISKVEMKTAKADLKEQKKVVSGLEESFKRSSKIAQKARVNQEIIAQKM